MTVEKSPTLWPVIIDIGSSFFGATYFIFLGGLKKDLPINYLICLLTADCFVYNVVLFKITDSNT